MLTLGNVEILPERRQVFVCKQRFNLGSRAFDMLEVLAGAGGALVSKEEIMRRVWPNTVVVENNLHVHISAIRKMLGSQASRLVAVPGRGYRLVMEPEKSAGAAQPDALPLPSGLPLANASIVGRDQAIEDVLDACARTALVSMVGPGGVGKTTLAVEAARRLTPGFRDGVCLVELARISDPNEVVNATLSALGCHAAADDSCAASVVQALGQKHMLIVLDNCEHVIQAAAEVALAIISGAPNCKVLATSREPLRIPSEVVYRVATLDVPHRAAGPSDALQCGAVRLFIERARAIQQQFGCDAQTVGLIGLICRRLDGMPLAIELAASRAATLGVRELAANLDDRFAVLTGGHRTALPHHRTLRATFDWSYNLLPSRQQVVFRRLGVFLSPFGMEAACAVAADHSLTEADVLDAVCALTEKSMIIANTRQCAARYSLLETCREFAIRKLDEHGEREGIERRHCSYVAARPNLAGSSDAQPDGELVFGKFQRHPDDIRTSLDWHFGGHSERVPGAFSVMDPALLRAIANRKPV